ncbi:hypothetical protein Tco_0596490 [Tanacetum coccineum]
MSNMLYTRFTKLIINHFLSHNKSIPHISSFKLHSSQDDQPITKLSNAVKGDYKFGMEILDTMINDEIKKLAGQTDEVVVDMYNEWGRNVKTRRGLNSLQNQSTTLQTLPNHKIDNIGFTHYPIHTITQDNQNRDLDHRRREEKSLIYNTSFLDEYECSSLALDRTRQKVEDEN